MQLSSASKLVLHGVGSPPITALRALLANRSKSSEVRRPTRRSVGRGSGQSSGDKGEGPAAVRSGASEGVGVIQARA